MRIRLVVLDVGGTVIHDSADVPAVFKAALSRHGLSATDSQLHTWRGAAKREVIGRLAAGSKADPEQVYATFQQLLIASFAEHGVQPIDGVEQAIAALRASAVPVALTTGFDRKVADGLLAGVGANLGVLSGAHARTRLEKAPHDAILASAAELPAWIERRNASGRDAEKKEARQ